MEENNIEPVQEVVEEKKPFNLIQFIKDIEVRYLILFVLIAIPLFFGGIVLVNDNSDKMATETIAPTPTNVPSPTQIDEISATPTPATTQKLAVSPTQKVAVPTPTSTTKIWVTLHITPQQNPDTANLPISVIAYLFEDLNCNGQKNDGESTIYQSTTVYLWKMPEYSTFSTDTSPDQNGAYVLDGNITQSDNIQFQVSAVSPAGYKSQGGTVNVTLNKSNSSTSVFIPQVPYDSLGSCSQ